MQAVAEGGQRSTYSVPGGVKTWGKNGAGCGPGADLTTPSHPIQRV